MAWGSAYPLVARLSKVIKVASGRHRMKARALRFHSRFPADPRAWTTLAGMVPLSPCPVECLPQDGKTGVEGSPRCSHRDGVASHGHQACFQLLSWSRCRQPPSTRPHALEQTGRLAPTLHVLAPLFLLGSDVSSAVALGCRGGGRRRFGERPAYRAIHISGRCFDAHLIKRGT
jgi:hypothetical protein